MIYQDWTPVVLTKNKQKVTTQNNTSFKSFVSLPLHMQKSKKNNVDKHND
jgi:hypothetical protein